MQQGMSQPRPPREEHNCSEPHSEPLECTLWNARTRLPGGLPKVLPRLVWLPVHEPRSTETPAAPARAATVSRVV